MATSNVIPISRECLTCSKPLGQDSKDLGIRFCHEHRKCSKCSGDLSAKELDWCLNHSIEDYPIEITVKDFLQLYKEKDPSAILTIVHPRCSAIEHKTMDQDPTLTIKKSEYDYLNLIRLSFVPNPDLGLTTNENNAMIGCTQLIGQMDFDQKLLFIRMMEACAAQASIAVKQDPKWRKDALTVRENQRQKQAEQEKKTSARPFSKPATDTEELLLAKFMEDHGVTERKVAMKIRAQIEKAVESMCKMAGQDGNSKFASDQRDLAIQQMVKSGALRK